MCRWIAYHGQPIFLEELITKPAHSLQVQGHNTRENYHSDGKLWPLNADGFGFGYYKDKAEPGRYRSDKPVWIDENVVDLCGQIKSPLFMAHIRATSTGHVQRTNCHPFKQHNWLFQHNGYISNFDVIKQRLHGQIRPDIYRDLHGSTDSETFFYLALTNGLKADPLSALRKTFQMVSDAYEQHGIDPCINFSGALSNGTTLHSFLYAIGDNPKTQYYSTKKECVVDLGEKQKEPLILPDKSVVIVSEPLNDNRSQWTAIPSNSFTTIADGQVQIQDLFPS